MTHAITEIIQGHVRMREVKVPVPVKIRETIEVHYFIYRGKDKVFITEQMALDPEYYPSKKRHREAVIVHSHTWKNTLNTGKKVWWRPEPHTPSSYDINEANYLIKEY